MNEAHSFDFSHGWSEAFVKLTKDFAAAFYYLVLIELPVVFVCFLLSRYFDRLLRALMAEPSVPEWFKKSSQKWFIFWKKNERHEFKGAVCVLFFLAWNFFVGMAVLKAPAFFLLM